MPGESQQTPHTAPDPTVLTTEQLERAIENLRGLMEARLDGMEDVFREKFDSVDRQLGLVEQQRVEQKSDTSAAVDAALTAQQKAVAEQTTASERSIAKSEAATTKSIEQLGSKFDAAFDGQRRDIDDLKGRVTTVVSKTVGGEEVRQQQGVTLGQGIAVAGVAIAGFGTVAAIVIAATP